MFFVTAHLGEPHGSAKSARDFVRSLLAHCADTHIVCPRTEVFGPSAAGYRLHEPTWYEEAASRRNFGRGKLGRVVGRGDGALRHLMRNGMRRRMRRDVVVVNGWASMSYWRSLSAFPQRSALIVRESPRHFQYSDRDIALSRMIEELSTFDQLIFVSSIGRDEWMQVEALKGKPSYYFPNCCEEEEVASVSADERKAVRAGLGLSADDKMIICPGTIEERKGVDTVLRKWGEILERVPKAKLIILGKGTTAYGVALLREIAAGVYGPGIVHVPPQPSAIPFICAADLMLFPSRAEALPRAVLEAMAAGTPVIASSVDGVPELIEHGRTGLLFDVGAEQAMVAGVVSALREPGPAAARADAARSRYASQFSRQRHIERMAELLSWLGIDPAVPL
jgi:glycosyltransferase involved in cell wall biosynthesis